MVTTYTPTNNEVTERHGWDCGDTFTDAGYCEDCGWHYHVIYGDRDGNLMRTDTPNSRDLTYANLCEDERDYMAEADYNAMMAEALRMAEYGDDGEVW